MVTKDDIGKMVRTIKGGTPIDEFDLELVNIDENGWAWVKLDHPDAGFFNNTYRKSPTNLRVIEDPE